MSAVPKDDLPHLRRHENPGRGLQRVVRRCAGLAGAGKASALDDATVHLARRVLKRARAVLRLGEFLELPRLRARRRRLAGLARSLSPQRDAAVIAHMAKKLAPKVDADARPALVELQLRERVMADAAWWRIWRRRLAAEIRALDRLHWGSPTMADVERALSRSVRWLCHRARKAGDSHAIATAHEWRKAVIALREQLAVTQAVIPRDTATLRRRLHELGDELGRAVDFQVLHEAVDRHDWPADLTEARDRLDALLKKKRRHALKRARRHWPALKRELCAAWD